MKKLLATLILVVTAFGLLGGLGGCATMTMDPQEHARVIRRNMELDCRQLVEDVDYALLVDQPSHLTNWYMPSKPH